MIDPLTALAGIQAAVALIKKVSKTVDDVSSLGPVLGKYFDAKSTATKAAVQAKKSKSSMGTAIQIEMALDQAKRFEDELQLLFMQSGKVDVWNKIKSRAPGLRQWTLKQLMMPAVKKKQQSDTKKNLKI